MIPILLAIDAMVRLARDLVRRMANGDAGGLRIYGGDDAPPGDDGPGIGGDR